VNRNRKQVGYQAASAGASLIYSFLVTASLILFLPCPLLLVNSDVANLWILILKLMDICVLDLRASKAVQTVGFGGGGGEL